MRLNPKDEDKINILKERYGLTQTSELVRFLITSIAYEIENGGKNTLSVPLPTLNK